ncbi:hypothetical protein RF55_7698 [Lasius niger]|uniref:Reverse transcriptase domain-containing protein n=1 Tax=Lasius niger TaxID=67767 RepID=A0A0J7NIJ5_LASNI|nr:hypothetical protein RF55_7698 [Lasius niger]
MPSTKASDPTEAFVILADGTQVPITQTANLPIVVQGRTITHQFSVLPNLGSPVLIGTDLWAKLKITLPPPPPKLITQTNPAIGVVTGDHTLSPDESKRLEDFLAFELPQFHQVSGPTDQAQHQILLKPGLPIKQRYRPCNLVMQAIIDQEVQKMEEEGIIEPSTSAWSSPIVIVKKDGGTDSALTFEN